MSVLEYISCTMTPVNLKFRNRLRQSYGKGESMVYRKASMEDLEFLTETRVEVLRAANRLSGDADMSVVREQSHRYYQRALCDGTHTAYLAFDGEHFAGAGGVSYFQVMPTYHNPSGNKAYIMNMYTRPEYRRRGIAYHMLELLVGDAKGRGITAISLEATKMGRPLYERYGFTQMRDEMELREKVQADRKQ